VSEPSLAANSQSGPQRSEPESNASRRDAASIHERRLVLMLRVVGGITLLAFAAAVMPEKWMIETAEALGFEPFPHSPLTFYLARNLSLLYGFVGVGLLVVTIDFDRYRPLVRYLAWGTMAFGVLQWVVDAQSSLPAWWTCGESASTFLGGLLIGWLDRRALKADQKIND
jgi:hypothetical protein